MALTIPKNETQVQTQKEQNQNIQATTQNQQQEQKEQSDTIKKRFGNLFVNHKTFRKLPQR